MPQLQGGVRHGFKVSRFPDFWPLWGGRACSLRPPWNVPGGPWVWSLGLFSSIFFSTSINKTKIDQDLPDRETSLIKKEYCRLSASPHSLQVTPSRARPPLVKGGQANWRPSLELWGSTSLQVNKPPLHCGSMPSHWRPSLVASLHSEGPLTRLWERNQVLEQMVGLLVHQCRGGGYLVLSRWVARMMTTQAHASAPRWGETWVRSIKIP